MKQALSKEMYTTESATMISIAWHFNTYGSGSRESFFNLVKVSFLIVLQIKQCIRHQIVNQ